MAKSKTRVSSLAKLLEGAPALVYVLNLEFEIQYASKACAEWVGLELDQLVGQRCVYTSSSYWRACPSGTIGYHWRPTRCWRHRCSELEW